ncbi:MAG: biotin--[acetyl-CoA-carboxylase] ligase [Deltaproteobacteria bacterium]|nr:biotin--[acetyl-CoA-carboxylase] ligase [Deltaproteobacteria bacterium]
MIVHRLGEVASTQAEARKLAEAGALHGTSVLAEVQTQGRGRLGRRWEAAPGENLLLSVVLRPPVPAREAPLLTLGAAAGVATTLDLRVKWPNDLVDTEGHKLGGFLAELEADGERVSFVILGLGLNVNQVEFPGLPNATSLRRLRGPSQDLDVVLDDVLRAILAWSAHPGRLDLWRERAHTLGRHVRVGEVEGVATGLRDDGALLVDGVPVLTGEVGA